MNVSRRKFCLLLSIAPISANASSLVNLEDGSGLFSNGVPSTNHLRSVPKEDTNSVSRIPYMRKGLPRLIHAHTQETLELNRPNTIFEKRRLDYFLRDWRENEVQPIHNKLAAEFFEVCLRADQLGAGKKIWVHSGYRTKATNESLRLKNSNVATNSFHIRGRAIDFSIEGLSSNQVFELARSCSSGGVGGYSSFVHMDTGPRRSWTV